MLRRFSILAFRLLLPLTGLFMLESSSPAATLPPARPFGKTAHGEEVTLYTLTNKNGMHVTIIDYGATIVNLVVPDRHGKMADVVLGFDNLESYLSHNAFFGCIVGRYCNRIAKGQFTLGRSTYTLAKNDGPNTLHGGLRGFDKRVWKAEPVNSESPAIRFTRLSRDGEEGYPGNLFVSVTYTLTDDNTLRIAYQATTDKTTVINLTSHSYFNLAGAGNGDILKQVLTLHANAFTPVDSTLIPTGQIKEVAGTPWDFRTPTPIGKHLNEVPGKPVGYDHNYVLDKGFFSDWALAAEVSDPRSGRTMKVFTDQPGVQFYTGNFLDGTLIGKGGKPYLQHAAFCLETQHYPDSPNHANFPSTVLAPGQVFKSTTVYAFGTK